ncbi:hypothetical protein ACEPAI_1307 [Sanghuangporus weigelae]
MAFSPGRFERWLSCTTNRPIHYQSLSAFVSGAPTVKVGSTTLTGTFLPDLQQYFSEVGTLCAESPVGQDVTKFGVACVQNLANGMVSEISEDCLTVNVFSPAGNNSSSSLPVMVWAHGSSFFQGSASMYNGSVIVAQSIESRTPIVYAKLNYRLDPLGFPRGEEAETLGETNLGNKDVILTWIKQIIGAFGGDKDKITIFGESAGTIIISRLLPNQTFALLQRLVKASDRENTWETFISFVPESEGASSTNTSDVPLCQFGHHSQCNDVHTCLGTGKKPILSSNRWFGRHHFRPSVKVVRKFLRRTYPFIAGSNLDEGTIFVPTAVNSTAQIQQALFAATSPSPASSEEQASVLSTDPARGFPFGVGNETFELSSQFKRAAAILRNVLLASLRLSLPQTENKQVIKAFAYLFTDPQTATLPANLEST